MTAFRCKPIACLIVVLLALVFSVGELQAQAVPSAESDLQQYPVVLRDRTSTHYQLPDGTIRAVFTVKPHNYQAPDGTWHVIDESVRDDDIYAYSNLSNGLMSRYSQAAVDGILFSAHNQPTIEMRPHALTAFDSTGKLLHSVEPQAAFATQQGEKTVCYPGLFPGATDEYVVGPNMVKHNLVLDRSAINGFENSATFGAQFVLNLPPNLSVVRAENGRTLHLVNAVGDVVYGLGPVDAFDATDDFVNGYLESTVDGDRLVVTMKIDTAWALEPTRSWPIRIDPTLTLQPDATAGKDTHIREAGPTSNYGNGIYIGSNYSSATPPNLHVLIGFDLSTLGSSVTVSAAQMELYHWSNSVVGDTFTVTEITGTWSEATVTWNNKPTIATSTSTQLVYPSGTGTFRAFTGLGTLAQAWVSGTSTNNGMYIINTTQAKFDAYHYSSDYATSTTLRPKFVVDYTTQPPSVSGVSPNPVDWLQTLTITGTNLTAATSVTIGGTTCAITSNTATQIQVTVPDTTPTGSQTVVVTTGSGSDNSQSVTVNGVAPSVNSVSPNPVDWLANLTISGSYMSSVSAVTVGGVNQSIVSTSATDVVVTISDSTPTGSQTIAITNPAGTDSSSTVTIDSVAPTVSGVAPDPVDWLGTLTITGNYLAQTSAVTIGGVTASVSTASTTQVVVTVSDSTPTGNQTVSVTTPGGTDTSQSVTVNGVTPVATSAAPDPVSWLQTLTITGNYLASTSAVTIGGVTQTLGTISTTSVEVTVDTTTPPGLQTIEITTSGGNNNSLSVTVNGLAPIVSGASPDPVMWSQTLTITGNYLGQTSSVTIGGVTQSITNTSATQVEVTVDYATPTGSQTIEITTPGGTNSSQSVTVNALPPSISSVSPDPVTWFATLTIDGAGLGNATSVDVGGMTLTPTANTDTQITVSIPVTMPTGSQSVSVTTAHGSDSSTVTVNGLPPNPTAVSPGSLLVGENITITGTALANATVTVGGVTANVSSNSDTQIVAMVAGATPTGTQTITVTTAWGSNSNLSVTVSTSFSSSGGGGSGGGGGGGCVADSSNGQLWMLLLGLLAVVGLGVRLRRA